MAHFAEIDENNCVVRVIVIDNHDCCDSNGSESEEIGKAFCQNLFGGNWIQTSYNHSFRKRFAGIGMTYEPNLDMFILPRPGEWFTLTDHGDWIVPLGVNAETGATLTPDEWEWLDKCFALDVTWGVNIG